MITIPVKIVRLNENVEIPQYATIGSAGFDLVTTETLVLTPHEPKLAPTGIKLEIPRGFELQIRPRSGLALKEGITVYNTPGTIDCDYRGEIGVILSWNGFNPHATIVKENTCCPHSNVSVKYINAGMKIAQAVLVPIYQAEFREVNELSETERGENGFGSTGV